MSDSRKRYETAFLKSFGCVSPANPETNSVRIRPTLPKYMKEGAPMTLRFGILLITCVSIAALAQEHQDHYDAVNKRGESHQGMGFSQTETTHHFLLTES